MRAAAVKNRQGRPDDVNRQEEETNSLGDEK
jgi:hypothetical protein